MFSAEFLGVVHPTRLRPTEFVMSKRILQQNIPGFGEYLRKRRVLSIFRSMLKATRQLEDKELRKSIKTEIVGTFKKCQSISDMMTIKTCISNAERTLTQLNSMVNNNGSSAQYRIGTEWPWSR